MSSLIFWQPAWSSILKTQFQSYPSGSYQYLQANSYNSFSSWSVSKLSRPSMSIGDICYDQTLRVGLAERKGGDSSFRGVDSCLVGNILLITELSSCSNFRHRGNALPSQGKMCQLRKLWYFMGAWEVNILKDIPPDILISRVWGFPSQNSDLTVNLPRLSIPTSLKLCASKYPFSASF